MALYTRVDAERAQKATGRSQSRVRVTIGRAVDAVEDAVSG
jgi:hypothetical protein